MITLLKVLFILALWMSTTTAFSATPAPPSKEGRGELYGIPGSGWASPSWNWGSSQGTGHDCAIICREQYATAQDRAQLIENLLLEQDEDEDKEAQQAAPPARIPSDFEQVKLVLALVWQRYRNMSAGNKMYGDLLDQMVDCRFEQEQAAAGGGGDDHDHDDHDDADAEAAASKLLVQEMQKRFIYLQPDVQDQIAMNTLLYEAGDDYDLTRRRCSGLVLRAMDFEELGL